MWGTPPTESGKEIRVCRVGVSARGAEKGAAAAVIISRIAREARDC
jgi:hypothetical protein